jgi:hypothetical protein
VEVVVSGYLGIVLSERTPASSDHQGRTRPRAPTTGEAAHQYSRPPRIGATLARRQKGHDPRIIEIAWRAQRRLYQRWQHLRTQRRKPAGMVAIAVARELVGFLWEARNA